MVNIHLRRFWAASAPLTATAILMLAALALSCTAIVLDAHVIGGVSAWLKPAKFAFSTALFCGTVAWLCSYITVWPTLMRATGWVLAVIFVLEVGIIDLQAARGATSHFNVSTPFDAALFATMGVSIAILWIASCVILAALFRQQFENPAWGWWLRLGMMTTVLGSAAGGLMLHLTPQQQAALHAGQRPHTSGGHTVGAPDGGPGLPGLGWSTQHGDLRIPHFLGLHGIQIIALAGWLSRRKSKRPQIRLAFCATASYLALMGILTWQALRGQPLLQPDASTLVAFTTWLALSVAATSAAANPWPGRRTPSYSAQPL